MTAERTAVASAVLGRRLPTVSLALLPGGPMSC